MKGCLFLLCLAICLPASGEVTIVGPDRLAVREAALLYVEGVTVDQFRQCEVTMVPATNRPLVVALQTLNNKPVLYVQGQFAGAFWLIVDVNIPDAYALVVQPLTIGTGPDPTPDPDPEPHPTPGEGLTVIVIEDPQKRTPDQQTVLSGPWRAWCQQRAYSVRQVRAGSPAPDAAKWIKGAGDLPFVYFVSDAGKVYEKIPLPATAADMLTRCKKWGAK